MIDDVARVIRLDRSVYAAEGRRSAFSAAQVVALVAIATTIGAGLPIATGGMPRLARPLGAVAGSLLDPFVHWLIWSALICATGAYVFHGRAGDPAVLRAIGYAMAPQALAILGFLPIVGPAVVLLGQLLSLRAGSLAVQEAEQLDSRRTIATIAVTFVVAFLVSGAVRAFLANIGLWAALTDPLRGA